MITQREFERTLAYVRRSQVHEWLEPQLRPTAAGRKRQLRVDVLLAGMMLVATHKPQLTQVMVHKLLTTELSRPAQATWDIRIGAEPMRLRQVRYLWNAITDLFEHTPTRRPDLDDVERARRTDGLHQLMDALTGAAGAHLGTADGFAVDQTAIESAARGKRNNAQARDAELEPDDLEVGRCADLDARWGYRTKTYDNKTNLMFGYQLTAFTRIGVVGAHEVPILVDRIRVVPGNSRGIAETVDVLRDYHRAGTQIGEVIADRGLTYAVADDWAGPLADLGVEQIIDMHPSDRGARVHPRHGYVMIDGWPHVASIPDHLVNIPRPARMTVGKLRKNATAVERAEHAARAAEVEQFTRRIAERSQYRFEVHGHTSNSSRRFISPARAGKMRCPGFPASLHLQGVPDCAHADGHIPPSCAQATITVDTRADLKLRQRHYWGSPEWIRGYARRTRVEGTFGIMKSPNDGGGVRRGWTHQVGLVKTAFALAVYIAAQNLRRLLDWAARHGDTRDPLTLVDITDHGFVELDADGRPLAGIPPPDAA